MALSALSGIPIDENSCIGDSLSAINTAFEILNDFRQNCIKFGGSNPSNTMDGFFYLNTSTKRLFVRQNTEWIEVRANSS